LQLNDIWAAPFTDPWTYIVGLTGGTDYTNATTTFTDVPGVSFSGEANKKYLVEVMCKVRTSLNTSGGSLALFCPGDATIIGLNVAGIATTLLGGTEQLSPTGGTSGVVTSFRAADTDSPFTSKWIVQLVNAGTIKLQARAETTDTFTVRDNCFAFGYRKLN